MRKDASFPNEKTVANHFGKMVDLVAALRELAKFEEYKDLEAILPQPQQGLAVLAGKKDDDGFVYLLKSGSHYKIGSTANLERRIKEITVAMPESVTLVHSIKTDDPSGIEAYWHKRFAQHRANGEWFRLSGEDLKAFRRRFFQ